MLNKRTHILFDETLWQRISQIAKERKITVGAFVRNAVEEKFEKELSERRDAIDSIRKHRKVFTGKIDYKALINEGRKY